MKIVDNGERQFIRSLRAARRFLTRHSSIELLPWVGKTITSIPAIRPLARSWIQRAFAGDEAKPCDELVTAQGLFYITEQRRLCLDATSGHYQMTWGYNHPRLNRVIREALARGIVWDCHASLAGQYVKELAKELVTVCQADGATKDPLNRVSLGTATGSAACSTAMKMAIKYYWKAKGKRTKPVFVALQGNYHGTDLMLQRLRGMWNPFFAGASFELVEPNDMDSLQRVFRRYGRKIAAIFCEPILMNREAIVVLPAFMRAVRRWTQAVDAMLIIDEIQTGFWGPDLFMYRQYGIVPDAVIIGKGMTAGFHPLSGLIFKDRFDTLAQYDSLNTNGMAPLPALVALHSLRLIRADRERIAEAGQYLHRRLQELPEAFPGLVRVITGAGLMAGIKLNSQPEAIEFHRRCLAKGLWLRVHAYHAGHSTVLIKFALVVERRVIDFVCARFHEILSVMQKG